ncbi:MAG TPA: bifunctional diaminohydroxyphosphoribosylaminopyrimidine deaminase/5-amino-6-(5-phosphoribosylamino)uracil reductase RibD [Arenimonas sp.]|nr:bifunctional diaminohydroxyphosphoribosylaminopyrimidine deaminase/5-amino-6-(5-phosphoribosylamino)uracil reductase RibD [Arenimonas sp.]HPW32145.1 bifunctional diaminohydroxyphosphoribosylaminopyrimidine deaminase/5-amino-6-(5-phosphoribosylamino)uracil reductase RibD [Arenimonas sp.]
MTFSQRDHQMMARALLLAECGAYTTKPNPMVGCVIARDDKIVGEGFHQRAGEPHAEVFALREAGELAQGATAFVTLEPCSHFGKTPPCADALVQAGITRVVAAIADPFHAVSGRGFEKLQAVGIQVEVGLMEQQARELNRGFLSRVQRGRPWTRIKLAMSLDGRTALASGESKWISSEDSRFDVAEWRARSGAILTSDVTVKHDDPHLTVRMREPESFKPPIRVVLDSQGYLGDNYRVFDDSAESITVHAMDVVPDYGAHRDAIAVPSNFGHVDLPAVLTQLAQRGVNEVQVEAGPGLSGAFLKQGLVDEILLYIAPVILGDHAKPLFSDINIEQMSQRFNFSIMESINIGGDIRLLLRKK